MQRPRVALGFITKQKAFFYGDIDIKWREINGTQKRINAGANTSNQLGHPVRDFFVRAAFGVIAAIDSNLYGRPNKKILIFESAGMNISFLR